MPFNHKQTLVKSFLSAFKGIKYAFKERNFFIMFIIGSLAIVFSFIFNLSLLEKFVIIILSILVLSLEIINTAIEKTLDKITKEKDLEIAKIKDLMAGIVLFSSIIAFIIGIWIFGKAIIEFIKNCFY